MQILILYFSRTGNTEKLAKAIVRGVENVEGVNAVLKNTDEVTKEDFTNSAGIIAGSPVYFGIMAAQLKKIFDEFVGIRSKMEGKVGAAFATSADPSGGKETTNGYCGRSHVCHGTLWNSLRGRTQREK